MTKKNLNKCVVCSKESFAGEALEILDYLCKKHSKDYVKQLGEEVNEFIGLSSKVSKPKVIRKKKYKHFKFPDLEKVVS